MGVKEVLTRQPLLSMPGTRCYLPFSFSTLGDSEEHSTTDVERNILTYLDLKRPVLTTSF